MQSLCVRPKQTDVDKILESLLYSFVVCVCFVCIFGWAMPVTVTLQEVSGVRHYSLSPQPKPLAELAGLSVGLAVLIGIINTHDLSGRFFRLIRATQKTTRGSVWGDVFHERSGVVQIGLADGRRILGWVEHYSDDPKESNLFLQKANWIDESNELVPILGPGILITKEFKIEYIEFLDYTVDEPRTESNEAAPSATGDRRTT